MPTLNEYLAGVRASADLPDTSGWSDYNTPGAWTSVKRGFGSGVGAVGSMLRDVAPGVGGAVEEWGQNVAKFNPRQYTTSADVLASPFSAAAEQIPETLGQVLPAALALLVTKNPLAAGAVMGGTSYAQNVGETRARQRELGQDTTEDALRAYAYGVPQAGLDVLFGPEAALMKLFSKSVGKGMTEAGARELAERGLLKTVGVEGAKAAAFEAPTEIGQSVLGRMATRESLTDADAAEEYFMSGFAGLAGGGGMGAITGPMTRANASKFVDQIEEARDVLTSAPASFEEIPQWQALQQQAQGFLKSVTENDFGLQQAQAFAEQATAGQRSILDEAAERIAAGENAKSQAVLDTVAAEQEKAFVEQRTKAREAEQAERDRLGKEMQQDLKLRDAEAKYDAAQYQPPAPVETDLMRLANILPAISAPTGWSGSELAQRSFGRLRGPLDVDLMAAGKLPEVESLDLNEKVNPYNLAGTVVPDDAPFALVNPAPYAFDEMVGGVQPYEAQFNTSNINDFITLGQQLGTSFQHAEAAGDVKTSQMLAEMAQKLIYDRMAEGFGTQPVNQMVPGRPNDVGVAVPSPVQGVQGEMFGPRGGVAPEARAPKQTKAEKRAAEAQQVWTQAQESNLTPEQMAEVKAGVDDQAIPVKEIKDRVDQFKTENANAQQIETPTADQAQAVETTETPQGTTAQGQAAEITEPLKTSTAPEVSTDEDALAKASAVDLRKNRGDDGAGFQLEFAHGENVDVANALEARNTLDTYENAYKDFIKAVTLCKRGK